ncbi:hypothetical protein, partial [Staphylococcus epidermidis]|uniref:hypothetical protein n=1 Tax=Staphylococcus epidermidis TaxID=1282 RepID=UPI0030C47AE9
IIFCIFSLALGVVVSNPTKINDFRSIYIILITLGVMLMIKMHGNIKKISKSLLENMIYDLIKWLVPALG